MPLTIKPVNSLSALHAVEIVNTMDCGNIHIWIGRESEVSDGTTPITYTNRGFMRTTHSILEGAHNCDNLQLDGFLYDLRFLKNWKMQRLPSPGGSSDVLCFRNSWRNEFIPCHAFVKLGNSFFVTYTNSMGRPFATFVDTDVSGKLVYFSWAIDGTPVGTGYYARRVTLYLGNISAMTTGGFPVKWKTIEVNVPLLERNLESLRTRALPEAHLQMMLDWESSVTAVRCTDPYYTSSSPITASSDVYYSYLAMVDEWLSALETYTAKRVDFGELHYRAIAKIDTFNANGIAYIRDVKNVLTELKSAYQLLTGNVRPKSLADLYLSYKYGLRQTAADTSDLLVAFKAPRKSGVSATETKGVAGGVLKCISTVKYNTLDGVFEDVYNGLRALDLLVSADNVWELIPFSFVVDWFADIDGKLRRIDQVDHLSHLSVTGVYDSYIHTGSVPASRFMTGMIGIIVYRRYCRHCSLDASFPLITSSKPSPISHWLEGTALIIQKLFK